MTVWELGGKIWCRGGRLKKGGG